MRTRLCCVGWWNATEVPFKDAVCVKSFCSQHEVSSRSVLQLAWALVLRCYVGNLSVCFACRHLEGTGTTLDPTAVNPAGGICKIDVEAETPLIGLLKEIEKQSSRAHFPRTKAPTFSTNDGRSPQGIPANTGLLLREDSSQDWPDMNGSTSWGWGWGWGDDSSIDVSTSPSSFEPLVKADTYSLNNRLK